MAEAVSHLERFHQPLTHLFPTPRWAPEYELGAAAVHEFTERGFVRGGRVLNEQQIDVLRARLELIRTGANPHLGRLYEIDEDYRRDPTRNVFHILGAWLIDEAFHDIVWHPAVTVKAAQLLGLTELRLWHDQVFYKPPHHPGVVTWHQDYSYWTRATPARHVTCWIGLDEATEESGCVRYVPRSHRWGLLPRLSLSNDMNAMKQWLSSEQLETFRPEPMILPAGECSFHHSHTLHGSAGNTSPRPRRGIVLNFMHPETRSADGTTPLLSGVPIVPEGQVIAGDFFPIVLTDDMAIRARPSMR